MIITASGVAYIRAIFFCKRQLAIILIVEVLKAKHVSLNGHEGYWYSRVQHEAAFILPKRSAISSLRQQDGA